MAYFSFFYLFFGGVMKLREKYQTIGATASIISLALTIFSMLGYIPPIRMSTLAYGKEIFIDINLFPLFLVLSFIFFIFTILIGGKHT